MRFFLGLVLVSVLSATTACVTGRPVPPPSPADPVRAEILSQCRPQVRELLTEIEAQLVVPVRYRRLAADDHVAAATFYDPEAGEARIMLRSDAEDVDLAHELEHLRLDLVDGFTVLAWRPGVKTDKGVLTQFACIRTYIDDEIVHARLVKMGFKADGEVIRPPLFDSIYADAGRFLDEGKPRDQDGMCHDDSVGGGTVRRTAFLVQAELIRKNYAGQLSEDHRLKLEKFIQAFRAHRPEEAALADQVLAQFRDNDVGTAAGHQAISDAWIRLAGLEKSVGSTRYRVQTKYVLPWPPAPGTAGTP